MTHDDEALERRLDWALCECVGGEEPPDVAAQVFARWQVAAMPRSDGGPSLDASTPRAMGWTAAAALLLGAAVVVALFFMREPAKSRDGAAMPMPSPDDYVQVSELADIERLPGSTIAVHGLHLGDDEVRALERLEGLQALRLSVTEACVYGLGLKTAHAGTPRSITDASFRVFASLPELRVLRLEGTYGITGSGLSELARAPRLESLVLHCLDTEDKHLGVLPQIPTLRSLELSFNHGFHERGVRAVANCRKLRALSLRGCQQLGEDVLTALASLPELEELDLGLIDGINWRSDLLEKDTRAQRLSSRARELARGGRLGATDAVIQALAGLPKLATLRLDGAPCTATGIAALGACASLRRLGLFGTGRLEDELAEALPPQLEAIEVCGEFSDAFCRRLVARLRVLRELRVPACYEITDVGVAALCTLPELRILELRQCRGLSAACFESLVSVRHLEVLDLRHCDFADAPFVARLRGALCRGS